jgi:hypothetical protein
MLKKRTGTFLSTISAKKLAMMSKTANAQTEISSMRTLAERLLHKFKVETTDDVVDEVEDLIEVIAITSLEPHLSRTSSTLLSCATALLSKHRT